MKTARASENNPACRVELTRLGSPDRNKYSGSKYDHQALNQHYADAHFYLAVTLEKMGRSPDARAHWRAYERLAPQGEWVELAKEFSD